MIKVLAAGLWMSATMLLSGYGTTQYLAAQKRVGDEEPAFVGLDYETVKPVNVPILSDGILQGYVVIKMVFTADGDTLRRLPVPPHPFLVDEAFRVLYSDETLDFRGLERYDLEALTARLKRTTNARLGQSVVHDVLVEEFNYFDKDDVITH
ncbi:hypothetical protein [Roseibium sediminicola]|uniref:Flagellar protein FliL n=1 Tax=Roseibium sediminicola TaxID=2933272 RepID=A0ABT0GPH5_9HYPH|nr:hypothetical protein [Roseibium sp. CAU 1639]MCK7611299.1 hypothetical protein [Roseibium sp. CAU 1639]